MPLPFDSAAAARYETEAAALGVPGPLAALVYRSRLLGADRSVCNWGGGNTSAKGVARDFRDREARVLWVKGSGSDLQGCEPRHFSALLLEPITDLLARASMDDQDMVDYLAHAGLHPVGPRPSIETLLHGFLPHAHVDHTHPDAIVALCTAEEGEAWARTIYGERAIWIPYRRPGFALARQCARAMAEHPGAELILLAKHGLITWGDTSEACYASTLRAIGEAEAFLRDRRPVRAAPPVAAAPAPASTGERQTILSDVLPWLRGRLAAAPQPSGPEAAWRTRRVVLSVDDSPTTLAFLADPARLAMAAAGAACPDHLVHTGRLPLILPAEAATAGAEGVRAAFDAALPGFAARMRAEYEECSAASGNTIPADPPAPRVTMIPGVGIVTWGSSKRMADVSRDLAQRALAVVDLLAGAGATYRPLGARDAFDVQYWPLERYKLTLQPPEREFSRQVAFITGGAGAIGRATAEALVAQGAHAVLADIDAAGAAAAAEELCRRYGAGSAIGVAMDVTDEGRVAQAFAEAVRAYGGVDVVVANAGIASSARIEETTLGEWRRNIEILGTGYFLTLREGARLLRTQGGGGCMICVASKNAVAAGRNIAAYGAAKAAELHLARCLAEELGPDGIRVNVVNPDAVLSGSRIWSSEWREARAKNYGIAPEELAAHYRQRTILGVNIEPADVAQAVAFLASSRAAKTTGAMLPVDGGVTPAFPR